jgi:hypothetical protein
MLTPHLTSQTLYTVRVPQSFQDAHRILYNACLLIVITPPLVRFHEFLDTHKVRINLVPTTALLNYHMNHLLAPISGSAFSLISLVKLSTPSYLVCKPYPKHSIKHRVMYRENPHIGYIIHHLVFTGALTTQQTQGRKPCNSPCT